MNEGSLERTGASPDRRRQLGARAESLCASALQARGWRIVERNWRVRIGEIDIVAIDGRDLVVVEVKAHRAGNSSGPLRPVLAVGRAKQRKLRRLAEAWLQRAAREPEFDEVRFDVVGITVGDDGSVAAWEHLEGAF